MKSFLRGLIRGLLFLLPVLFISCGIFYVSYLKNAPGQEESSKEPLLSEETVPVSAGDVSSMPVTDIPDASEAPVSPKPGEAPENDKEPEEAFGPVTLTFAGDILFTEYPLSGYQARGISSLVSDELLAYMTGSDLFMLNEEFPFSTRGEAAADKQYTFRNWVLISQPSPTTMPWILARKPLPTVWIHWMRQESHGSEEDGIWRKQKLLLSVRSADIPSEFLVPAASSLFPPGQPGNSIPACLPLMILLFSNRRSKTSKTAVTMWPSMYTGE